jgi:hypothetical protein
MSLPVFQNEGWNVMKQYFMTIIYQSSRNHMGPEPVPIDVTEFNSSGDKRHAISKTKTKLRGLIPLANYTDRVTTACQRS